MEQKRVKKGVFEFVDQRWSIPPCRRRKLVGLGPAASSARKLNESRAHNYEHSSVDATEKTLVHREGKTGICEKAAERKREKEDKIAKVTARNNNNCCFGRAEDGRETNIRRNAAARSRKKKEEKKEKKSIIRARRNSAALSPLHDPSPPLFIFLVPSGRPEYPLISASIKI